MTPDFDIAAEWMRLLAIPEFQLTAEWARFLSGHWQKEQPQKPGAYPTADRFGAFCGYGRTYIVRAEDGGTFVMGPGTDAWGGWWWSEPLPNLPKPPPWNG